MGLARGIGCCSAWRGLLHEVGGFVSTRAHHKHCEYVIANSEIFGSTAARSFWFR